MSCGQPELDTPTCNVNTDFTSDPAQAAQWIIGQWKLVEVSAMIPNPPVENLRLRFTNDGHVTLIRDDRKTATYAYAINKTSDGLRLKSSDESSADNCYVRNASLRICADGLFLDCGMALDLPGYRFQRFQ